MKRYLKVFGLIFITVIILEALTTLLGLKTVVLGCLSFLLLTTFGLI